MIVSKIYNEPPISEKEILRYAGCTKPDESIYDLLRECIREATGKFTYRVCHTALQVSIHGEMCDFGFFQVRSAKLASNISGCDIVIAFAATVGIEIDRTIAKYSRVSPSKALMFQAMGAERIESLCDCFCDDINKQYSAELRPRFSPGYGDLSVEVQKDIFAVLDCERKIGLTLNNSFLMSPSKSVTAFIGIENDINSYIQKR